MTPGLALPGADRRLLPEGRMAGPMPWVIAIMTFLMVLTAAAGLSLGHAANAMGTDLANRITIQIVEPNAIAREGQTQAAMAELRRLSPVVRIDRIPDDVLRQQLAPWLGDIGDDTDLPMPALVDVTLRSADPRIIEDLTRSIRAVAPAARIDAQSRLLGPVSGLLGTLRWLAGAIVVLMASAMAAAVVLSARAALNTHRATIEVMHLMGATDAQIARLFERRVALDAAFGGVAGLVGGALVVWLIGRELSGADLALGGTGGLTAIDYALIALLPVAVAGLAILAARVTARGALAKML